MQFLCIPAAKSGTCDVVFNKGNLKNGTFWRTFHECPFAGRMSLFRVFPVGYADKNAGLS